MAMGQVQFARFNFNTAATNQVVAAPGAGNKIVVINFVMNCNAATSQPIWQSAANPLCGPLGGVAGLAGNPCGTRADPLFECNVNEALNIAQASATVVAGSVAYMIVTGA